MSSTSVKERKRAPSSLSRLEAWLPWSVETIILIGFITILVLVGVIGWLSYRNTMAMKKTVLWVDHTHEVIEMLKELELDIRESEAALHAYMLTGDGAWRDEYQLEAFHDMDYHLAGIRRLTLEDLDQVKRLDQITPMIKKCVSNFEEQRKGYESHPDDKVREADRMRLSALEAKKMVSLFSEFTEREEVLLGNRIAKRELDARRAIEMIIASGLLAFLSVSVALYLIFRALRSRRKAEEKLMLSLAEKEILLKEVHHRVKNNLQVISSLLSLESDKISNPEAAIVFKECRDRIHLMARLHQQLYSTEQFTFIDFGEHLTEMAEILVRSHMPVGCTVTLEIQAKPIIVDLDMAVTLGFIATEVILNSLKHAFSGRITGTLSVELHDGPFGEIVICDDGNGLPQGFEPTKGGSTGLELVFALSRQINGETIIGNRPAGGTSITIRFPTETTKNLENQKTTTA